jgi:hypothetical protein
VVLVLPSNAFSTRVVLLRHQVLVWYSYCHPLAERLSTSVVLLRHQVLVRCCFGTKCWCGAASAPSASVVLPEL